MRTTTRSIRNGLHGCVLPAVCLLAWPAAAQEAAMPGSLQGYWYQNDRHGQQQCGRFLADPENELAMVGQLRIRERDFDTFSEYGEGNHSQVTAVQPQGADQWRVSELSFIEGDAGHGKPGESVFRFSGGVLQLSDRYTLWRDGVPTQQISERTYFRCK